MGLLDIPSYDRTGGIIALILAIVLNGLGIAIWGLVKGEKNTIIQGVIILVITIVGAIILNFLATIGGVLALVWGIIVLVRSW